VKPLRVLLGGATLIAAVVSAAPAVANGGQRTITLHARSEVERVQFVDNQPAGPSAHDVLLFTEQLFDGRGNRIGSDAATCMRLFDETSLCTGVYRLPRGRLMVQLLQPGPAGTYDQAITGGTGRYAGASGTVRVAQRAGGDRFTFRVRLGR